MKCLLLGPSVVSWIDDSNRFRSRCFIELQWVWLKADVAWGGGSIAVGGGGGAKGDGSTVGEGDDFEQHFL